MTSDQAAKYLWDAWHAANRIARFTAGRSYDDYLADKMLRAARHSRDDVVHTGGCADT